MSQLTDRIRLYGTDCFQVEFVLNAIQALELNMTISLGVWIDKSLTNSKRQMKQMRRILETYPIFYIDSILIGNEALFRGDMDESELISHIETTKAYMKSRGFNIPVGTSEIGSKWTKRLAQHVDILAANIHPFFGGVPVNMSAKWTYEFLYEKVLQTSLDLEAESKNPSRILISEVGWPSGGGRIKGSIAGVRELQEFMDSWVCSKDNNNDVGWYWFEAFDEPWKKIFNKEGEEWETQWGIFDQGRRLKDGIRIPDRCPNLNDDEKEPEELEVLPDPQYKLKLETMSEPETPPRFNPGHESQSESEFEHEYENIDVDEYENSDEDEYEDEDEDDEFGNEDDYDYDYDDDYDYDYDYEDE